MEYTYLKQFNKSDVVDMDSIQAVLEESKAIIDSSLFPIIEEAENDNFDAMAELFEMFAYGHHDVTPNYEMANRYYQKLHSLIIKEMSDDHKMISQSLNSYAYMQNQFQYIDEATEAFMKAFRYMVTHLEPEFWDKQIVQLVAENLDGYQGGKFLHEE